MFCFVLFLFLFLFFVLFFVFSSELPYSLQTQKGIVRKSGNTQKNLITKGDEKIKQALIGTFEDFKSGYAIPWQCHHTPKCAFFSHYLKERIREAIKLCFRPNIRPKTVN